MICSTCPLCALICVSNLPRVAPAPPPGPEAEDEDEDEDDKAHTRRVPSSPPETKKGGPAEKVRVKESAGEDDQEEDEKKKTGGAIMLACWLTRAEDVNCPHQSRGTGATKQPESPNNRVPVPPPCRHPSPSFLHTLSLSFFLRDRHFCSHSLNTRTQTKRSRTGGRGAKVTPRRRPRHGVESAAHAERRHAALVRLLRDAPHFRG